MVEKIIVEGKSYTVLKSGDNPFKSVTKYEIKHDGYEEATVIVEHGKLSMLNFTGTNSPVWMTRSHLAWQKSKIGKSTREPLYAAQTYAARLLKLPLIDTFNEKSVLKRRYLKYLEDSGRTKRRMPRITDVI